MFRYAQYVEILPLYLFIGLNAFHLKIKLNWVDIGLLYSTRSKKLRNRILVNLKLVDTFKVDDIEGFIKAVGISVGKTLTELIFNKEFIETNM